MLKEIFYDIEAFANLFTCSFYCPQTNTVDVYFLCDENSLLDENGNYKDEENAKIHILEVNGTLLDKDTQIRFYNLQNKKNADSFVSSFVKMRLPHYETFFNDTDNAYSKENGSLLFGYNSANYDLTMLAFYVGNSYMNINGIDTFQNTLVAKHMYDFNNLLFEKYRERMSDALGEDGLFKDIYWSMLNSGRHIDVSNLNEKQSKVALKRLLGMLGYQIKESDLLDSGNKTPITSFEMFNEAVAYNVSDICGLEKLFRHDIYSSAFELKSGLLETYPELIYKQDGREYKPFEHQDNVKKGRLRIDSTSANFATKALCPYQRLKDYPTVSFLYPEASKAKELGVPQINVLENVWEWYQEQFKNFPEIVAFFKKNIYDYYKQIEGKNFNSGDNYIKDYGKKYPAYNIKTLRPLSDRNAVSVETNGCVEYYTSEGKPTGCFAAFSIGGIHGAEYNMALFLEDCDNHKKEQELFNKVKAVFPNPHDLRVAKKVEVDGVEYPFSTFLKSGATIKDASSCVYKAIPAPMLFKLDKTSWKLNDRYSYTSSCLCDHEDFSSYYPSLLINMNAMFNEGLGYDRYKEIYGQKESYGKLMKDKSKPAEERAKYGIKRSGTKLILNSASGAGDLLYDSAIRMNNKILSMRLIGQLFTFRMAQEQTLVGARVPSTNTDGIYVITPDKELTRGILKDLEKLIQVKIEPEEMYLISKDTNNRIELSADRNEILSASGGTLGCFKAPSPDKALSHPAIIDNGLATWLQCYGYDLSIVPTHKEMLCFLNMFIKKYSIERVLLMFQNIIASSTGSQRFHLLVNKDFDDTSCIKKEDCVALQHYNRMYFVKPEYSNSHLALVTQKAESRVHPENESDALYMLEKFGVTTIENGNMASFIKSSGIDPKKTIRIYNAPIVNSNKKEELIELVSQLDLDTYADMIIDKFRDCWANIQ